jgi:hypothetical protein
MKKDSLTIVDIVVSEPSKVPASYYLNAGVQEALRKAIRTDVVFNDKDCPPGTSPIYGPPRGATGAGYFRFRVARSDFFRAIMRELPGLIAIYVALVATILIFMLVRAA